MSHPILLLAPIQRQDINHLFHHHEHHRQTRLLCARRWRRRQECQTLLLVAAPPGQEARSGRLRRRPPKAPWHEPRPAQRVGRLQAGRRQEPAGRQAGPRSRRGVWRFRGRVWLRRLGSRRRAQRREPRHEVPADAGAADADDPGGKAGRVQRRREHSQQGEGELEMMARGTPYSASLTPKKIASF